MKPICSFSFFLLLLFVPQCIWSQINIAGSTPVIENFDAMGSSTSLPANWKMSPTATNFPTWNDTNFIATNQEASSGSPTTGGRYNWGKTGGTDRSIGFISSVNYKSQNSIMAWYRNIGPENLISLTVSYDLFQFRNYIAKPVVSFFYSTDGSNWISFSPGNAQDIDTSASSIYNFSTPANFGRSINAGTAPFTITNLNIPVNGDIYLRWSFKTVGSSNSEGLGLDNVSVTATFCSPIDVTSLAITPGNGRLTLTWTNPSCFDEILIVAATHNPITSVPTGDGSVYTASSIYGGGISGNNLTLDEFAVYKSSGSSILVTGLNNDKTYYFKVFTRRGTGWSNGVTISGIPTTPFMGDFRSKSSGDWTNPNTWEKFSGGVWVDAVLGEFPNYKTSNVIISAGTTVRVNGSGPYFVNSLIVLSSGKLFTNASTGTNNYLSVYGNIVCDGAIGNNLIADDISFTIESSTCTISGSGAFFCSRIRKQWTNTTTDLLINMNITTHYSTATRTQLYNYSNGAFNITINPGFTFTCKDTGNVSIDGFSGLDLEERNGSLNVYGTLTITGMLNLTTNNTGAGKGVYVNIFNGGVINTNSINAAASGTAAHTLHIYNGGKLNITGTAGWSSFSPANNAFVLDPGAIVEYSAIGNQAIETGISNYSNLTCSGSGNKILNGNTTVNGVLSLSSVLAINDKTLTLNGSINGSGTLTGSTNSNLSIGGTGGNLGTVRFTNGAALLNLLTLNRVVTGQNPAAVLGSSLSVNSLALTNGILVTGNNLLTWNNEGGILTAPEPTYTANSMNYTKSFIATCDDSGTPINVAGATTAFTGDAGFRIKNVRNINTYFPVGASFLPAMSGQPASPNRMMINTNSTTPQDFTVVVNYGDIGYTNGGGGALRVNRIWYVKTNSSVPGQATMKLFFTKRDNSGWPVTENEVEAGFNYDQPALVQKDYSGGRGNFINLSEADDINPFISGHNYNTEIYGQYTIGISKSLTDGIEQFNRFSVVNPQSIVLPVSIVNLRASQQGGGVQISWTALNEINVDHYEVEKSANAIDFIPIGEVYAKNDGNIVNYMRTDPKPVNGNNFYRIKSIDKDASITYTEIVKVPLGDNKTGIEVYPNPVINHTFTLQLNNLPEGNYTLLFYSATGQVIFTKIVEHNTPTETQTIQLPNRILPGSYFIRIVNQQKDYSKKLIVPSTP